MNAKVKLRDLIIRDEVIIYLHAQIFHKSAVQFSVITARGVGVCRPRNGALNPMLNGCSDSAENISVRAVNKELEYND